MQSNLLDQAAQRLIVEAKKAVGSPPVYGGSWLPVYAARIERIEHDINAGGSTAVIWFPGLAWNADHGFRFGDMIRIRTENSITIFQGFYVRQDSGFFGGDHQQKAWERNALYFRGHLWLLGTTSVLTGQLARSPDDYTGFGTDAQAPITGAYTYLTGRRCIFNENGRPNRDPDDLAVYDEAGGYLCPTSIFADADRNAYWTARQMMSYVLCPIFNNAYGQLTITDPANLLGLDHDDWNRIILHLGCEGLSVVEAVDMICQRNGWGYREYFDQNQNPTIHFFKIGAAAGSTRTLAHSLYTPDQTTILHTLHAPAQGEAIADAVAAGYKMIWGMDLVEDISPVVNAPVGLGGLHLFEFTAELVPAWDDNDYTPDTSDNNVNLYFTDADLQYEETPDDIIFYKHYHPRGNSFKREVGRRWTLNESGRATGGSYDRGAPFNFASVIPPDYIKDENGKRIYSAFNRQLLPCLTANKDGVNSVGIKVEFSFDGGSTWQVIPAAVSSLPDECGIYIDQANLAELVDQAEGLISGGDLDGVQLNYYTSLADDKINSRSFKNGEWKTRLRITASVQMDQRLYLQPAITVNTGSPFHHVAVHDVSSRYALGRRTSSSSFADSDLPAREVDDTLVFNDQIRSIQEANQDMSLSGQFTFRRLWLDDGSSRPVFAVGDAIEKITGRGYSLRSSFGGGSAYPEIVKIVYYPEKQEEKLITRDLRFAEMNV